jgi:hypothetical protein
VNKTVWNNLIQHAENNETVGSKKHWVLPETISIAGHSPTGGCTRTRPTRLEAGGFSRQFSTARRRKRCSTIITCCGRARRDGHRRAEDCVLACWISFAARTTDFVHQRCIDVSSQNELLAGSSRDGDATKLSDTTTDAKANTPMERPAALAGREGVVMKKPQYSVEDRVVLLGEAVTIIDISEDRYFHKARSSSGHL